MKTNISIPKLPAIAGWKQVEIKAPWIKDPLVPIGLFTDYSQYFFVDPIYSGLMESSPYKYGELSGSLIGAYLLKSIVKKIIKASSTLKERHMFLIWDAYRPLPVQKALFDFFTEKLVAQHGGEALDYLIEAQKFVSLPSSDPSKPSPHSTGAVVDITIIEFTQKGWFELKKLNSKLSKCKDDKEIFEIEMRRYQLMRTESQPLDMGTMFDQVSPETNLYFYEDNTPVNELDALRKKNRRYLFHTLWNVGFVGYEEEWWHYSYGDQFWAKKLGKSAKFSYSEMNKECLSHEKIMSQAMRGVVIMSGKTNPGSKLQARHLLFDFVKEVVNKTGDVRKTLHPQAASI